MLNYLFRKKTILNGINWIILLTIGYLLIFSFTEHIERKVDKQFNARVQNKIESYYLKSPEPNLDTICIIAGCEIIVQKLDTGYKVYSYNSVTKKLDIVSNPSVLKKAHEINPREYSDYHVANLDIYGSPTIVNDIAVNATSLTYTFTSILFLAILFVVNFLKWVKSNYKEREMRENLEDHTQKRITESLHHEVGNPVQGLRDLFSTYISVKYPCYVYNGYKDVTKEECTICGGEDHTHPCDEDMELLKLIDHNFERINSVLNLLSRSKSVKNASESINLKELLDLTRNEKVKLNISKVNINLEEPPYLNHFYLDNGFENGLFVNIISSMITNSIEAGSNNITIRPVLSDDGKRCSFFISDNGTGVLGLDGKLTKSRSIFQYGYSSKDPKWVVKRKSGNWFRDIIDTYLKGKNNVSTRGFGLSINRDILRSYGGDICLFENTHSGATFKIDVDVVEKVNQ